MLPFSHVHFNMQSQLRPVDQGKGHLEAFRKSCTGKDSVSPTKAGRVGGVLTLTLSHPLHPRHQVTCTQETSANYASRQTLAHLECDTAFVSP